MTIYTYINLGQLFIELLPIKIIKVLSNIFCITETGWMPKQLLLLAKSNAQSHLPLPHPSTCSQEIYAGIVKIDILLHSH